ncbi:HAD family hydrolase [Nonomuraea jiangxiensis]|uniref:2-haloalkanoic acid dehalogenase, type II n=1 Tax=Nonomuraea jiangxiensis TaxID=633440 RepID=A0A1G8IAM7_9ACTN|nr:HAD-IA family hydrolase [Nonomuraea jiangxiensis]SDI15902.1 2-haloalkanoic acid dehalogenase, type II [Nonomuraea jiangxiensis]
MTGVARPGVAGRYEAVLFDLLTAVLDSWSLWDSVAGGPAAGREWRGEYLRLAYGAGSYTPYEELVAAAARARGLGPELAPALAARWDELAPWPEAPRVIGELARHVRTGVVTNCSRELGRRAAERAGVPFDVVVTAEEAGAYKPRPEPYRMALDRLGLPAERVLFVAGSRYDIPGAGGVGMDVWWHNRIHLPLGDLPAPIAEYDRLTPLLDTPSTDRDEPPAP